MASYSFGSSLLTDAKKRWLVAGIALNNIILSQLRLLVKQEIKTVYNSLKTSHGIHLQSASGCLRRWSKFLNYENINGNENHPKLNDGTYNYSLFDCRVMSHIDFAKLYLEKYMCNSFDDCFDASALLCLLGSVPVFSVAVQASAGAVIQSRNDWAHCDFSKWDQDKYQQSFVEMENLVRVMALPAEDKSKLIRELDDWKSRGMKLSMNSPEMLQLILPQLKSLQDDVIVLTKKLVKEEAQQLQNVAVTLDKMKHRLQDQSRICGKCDAKLTKFHTFWHCSNQHTICDNCVVDHWWDTNSYTCTYQDCKELLQAVHPLDSARELLFVFVNIDYLSEEYKEALDIGKVIDAVANDREVAMVTLYNSEAPSSSGSLLDKESEYEWKLIITGTSIDAILVTDIVRVVSDKSLKSGKIVIVSGDPSMIPAIQYGLSKNWPFDIWMCNNCTELDKLQGENASMLKIFSLESVAGPATSPSERGIKKGLNALAVQHTADIDGY